MKPISRDHIEGFRGRYLGQRTSYDCAPVAIINWWKSQGLPASAADLPQLRKLLGTDKKTGTLTINLEAFLGRSLTRIAWRQLVNHLRHTGPAIFSTNTPEGHTWLAHTLVRHPKTKNLGVIAINYTKHTYTYLTQFEMKHILKRSWGALL